MVVVIDVRPLSAALSVLIPLVIESRRLVNSQARADSAAAVKKLVGLSRAELTFLPVARRCCVVACRLVVSCRASRFERTAAERVTEEDMLEPFWSCTILARERSDHSDRCRSFESTSRSDDIGPSNGGEKKKGYKNPPRPVEGKRGVSVGERGATCLLA